MVALVFGVALLGSGIHGQLGPQDSRVTFEARASRVESILPELSKASGTQLLFSPQTRDEVLVIKVKDVPLRSLMDQIAKSTKAEWRQELDGWRLIRTPALLAAIEKEHATRIERRFQVALDNLRKRLEKAKEIDNATAAVVAEQIRTAINTVSAKEGPDLSDHRFAEAIEMSFPGPKLAAKIALSIPASTYANAPLGTPIVFTVKPKRLQRSFPRDVSAYLDSYSRSARLLRSHLPNGVTAARTGFPTNIYQVYRMLLEPEVEAARIHFIFTRFAPGNSSTFQLKVANEKGKIIDQSELAFLDLAATAPPIEIGFGESSNETIPLSNQSRKWLEVIRRVSRGQPSEPGPEFQKFLTDSLASEPAQCLYSDLIFGLAAAAGRDIVASTSVGRGDLSSFGVADLPPTADRFLRFLQSGYPELSIQLDGNFIRIEPTDWVEKQMYSIESRARARFRSKSASFLGIDDIAILASSVNAVHGFATELRLVRALAPKSGLPESYQYELLRILGSMSFEQKRAAESETGLPWTGLTPQQQSELFQLMFSNERMRMSISEPGAFDANGGHVWKRESIDYQASELYSNGIPEGSVLRTKSVPTPTPRLEFVIETFPNVMHQATLMLPSLAK